MKIKSLLAVAVLALVVAAPVCNAEDNGRQIQPKIKIVVCGESVRYKVGNLEYIGTIGADSDQLQAVRVWDSPDMLLYDLTPAGADYKSTASQLRPAKPMTQKLAAIKWAEALDGWENLRKVVGVEVIARN